MSTEERGRIRNNTSGTVKQYAASNLVNLICVDFKTISKVAGKLILLFKNLNLKGT